MKKKNKEITFEGGFKPKYQPPKLCSRCGNDLLKGAVYFHFPYEKRYVALCHICEAGFLLGSYEDFIRRIKNLSCSLTGGNK